MRLAVGNVGAPFLLRRTVLIAGHDAAWRPLSRVLADAGLPSARGGARSDAMSRERLRLPAALDLMASLKRGERRKIEAVLDRHDGRPEGSPDLVSPVDGGAKVMVVGGWFPVSRPDLAPAEVTPHTMERWMEAEDFKRPPITVFKKFPSAIADPGAALALPILKLVRGADSSGTFDADAALAVVIGRPALRVPARQAMKHVVGLSLMIDVWDHEVFLEESRVRRGMLSKNLRALSPLGPSIEILDDGTIDDDLELAFAINGVVRQRFRVGDLAYRIADVVAFCSSMGLEPGDILAFGTRIAAADGQGPLETPVPVTPGDTLAVAAPPLGTLDATVVAGERTD